MRRREQMRRLRRQLIATCYAGLDGDELRLQILRGLRQLVPVDAAFFASADPSTLLFTGAISDEISAEATPLFRANEIGGRDFNHFTDLARRPVPIEWLDRATGGQRGLSPRYREIMAPMGLGDELRLALRTGTACWGFVCLHREDSPSGFGVADEEALRGVLGHVAEALRRDHAFPKASTPATEGEAGVILLHSDLTPAGSTPSGEAWLADLAGASARPAGWLLPVAVLAVAEHLCRLTQDTTDRSHPPPRVRVCTPSGQWLALHASWLQSDGPARQIAVVIEPVRRHELAPLILGWYGLTLREGEVARLVLQGLSTDAISSRLRITADTVQDHLKRVFDKSGVRSRRELVLAVSGGMRPPA